MKFLNLIFYGAFFFYILKIVYDAIFLDLNDWHKTLSFQEFLILLSPLILSFLALFLIIILESTKSKKLPQEKSNKLDKATDNYQLFIFISFYLSIGLIMIIFVVRYIIESFFRHIQLKIIVQLNNIHWGLIPIMTSFSNAMLYIIQLNSAKNVLFPAM